MQKCDSVCHDLFILDSEVNSELTKIIKKNLLFNVKHHSTFFRNILDGCSCNVFLNVTCFRMFREHKKIQFS